MSSKRKEEQVARMENMYEDAKQNANTEVLKIEYNEHKTMPINVNHSQYFDDIERNGAGIESRLISNQEILKNAITKRENEIFAFVPILNLQLKTYENKTENPIPQRKIWEMINLKKHEKKTQEIKIDEDEDFDEELELFHSRYQNSYLVVDKTFPSNIPKDDLSEKSISNEGSEYSHSQRSKLLDNKLQEVEVPMLTPEVGKPISIANFKESKLEDLK